MNQEPLSREAILANIDHYESLVNETKDIWQQHLCQLQYWLEQLEKQV
jgi:L-lactate utilization protein LutB